MLKRRPLDLRKKKGDFTGVLYLVASISVFAIFLLILSFIGVEIAEGVRDQMNSSSDEVNKAFNTTITVSTVTLPALWYIMFGGLLIGLFITAWFIPTHPVFAVPFIILLTIAIIVAVAMSNTYEALQQVTELQSASLWQSGIGWVMSQLPFVALVVGIIALVVTFAKPGEGTGGIGSGFANSNSSPIM